jgi:hypothetical protein
LARLRPVRRLRLPRLRLRLARLPVRRLGGLPWLRLGWLRLPLLPVVGRMPRLLDAGALYSAMM